MRLRAEALDKIAAVLPINRRDMLAGKLTDQDAETLRHLVKEGMGTLLDLTAMLVPMHLHYGVTTLLKWPHEQKHNGFVQHTSYNLAIPTL